MNSEKYSRGRRGAPAKGVGRETGARVQIPLSPLFFPDETTVKTVKNKFKKVVDKRLRLLYHNLVSAETDNNKEP